MNDINKLRAVLFEQLDALTDKAQKVDVERCKQINDTAKNIIATGKTEVDFMRVTGATNGSGFIPVQQTALPGQKTSETQNGIKTVEQKPGYSITTHRLK